MVEWNGGMPMVDGFFSRDIFFPAFFFFFWYHYACGGGVGVYTLVLESSIKEHGTVYSCAFHLKSCV